jgi:hypothetical protein
MRASRRALSALGLRQVFDGLFKGSVGIRFGEQADEMLAQCCVVGVGVFGIGRHDSRILRGFLKAGSMDALDSAHWMNSGGLWDSIDLLRGTSPDCYAYRLPSGGTDPVVNPSMREWLPCILRFETLSQTQSQFKFQRLVAHF